MTFLLMAPTSVVALLWAWIAANPWTAAAVATWVVMNIVPRPVPKKIEGTWMARAWVLFWIVVDRASILSAGKVPGRFKWLFAATPEMATASESNISKNEGAGQ